MERVERHTHNQQDSPQIAVGDVDGGLDSDDVVLLTTAQTVAGVKTFSSIPVLPASDPTTDNQAVRKAYVDGQYEVVVSDDVIDSADTTRTEAGTAYVLKKEIEYNEIDGDIRVTFELQLTGGSGTAYAKVYTNGSPVGVERTEGSAVFVQYDEDFSVSKGDLIQLYAKKDGGTDDAQVKNFRLRYDKILVIIPGTVNTD